MHTKSLQSCSILCRPYGLQPIRLLCPWDSPARILEWIAISFSNVLYYYYINVQKLRCIKEISKESSEELIVLYLVLWFIFLGSSLSLSSCRIFFFFYILQLCVAFAQYYSDDLLEITFNYCSPSISLYWKIKLKNREEYFPLFSIQALPFYCWTIYTHKVQALIIFTRSYHLTLQSPP